LLNLPNLLTMFRLFLVPCFFAALYYHFLGYPHLLWVARGIVILIVISDALDGYLARKWHKITELGKFLDPLADKLFVTCSYILLTAFDQVPAWLTIAVVAKDLLVSFGWCALALLYQRYEIKPSIWGKLATGFQFTTICVIIFFPNLKLVLWVLMILTAGFTITALLNYGIRGLRFAATGKMKK